MEYRITEEGFTTSTGVFIPVEKYTEKDLASDVETDGLLEKVTQVWCIVSRDIESKEVFLFHDHPEFDGQVVIDEWDDLEYTIPKRTGSLEDGYKFWELASQNESKLIVHNCSTFDKKIIDKFCPDNKVEYSAWHDTLIQSKIQWYDRPTPRGCKGAHGLAAYGMLMGVGKPEVKDWSFIDPFKIHRCIQDCEIQAGAYIRLEKERAAIESKLGIDIFACYLMEAEYAESCADQEMNGAFIDQLHLDWCIKDLDGLIGNLKDKIEPQLPPTIKKHGVKVGRKEVVKALYGKDIDDRYEIVYENGVGIQQIVKDYYKPTTRYTRTIKSNHYSGFNISCGGSPTFPKKKQLTDWIKENYPDFPPKTWEIEKEEKTVEVLNKITCDFFGVDEESDLIGGHFTKISFKDSQLSQSEVVKSLLVRLGWKHAEEWNKKKDSDGNFVKATEDIEVRWPSYANKQDQMVRKVKKGQVIVTTPKLDKDDYEQLPEGLGKDISHYNTYSHRRRFLENPEDDTKGLKNFIREDGRVGCGVNNFNTSTGRSSQSKWVNVPGGKALYGKECRSIIVAPENRVLVGSDMKSAQLSIAAYYANNQSYYDAVANGEEFKQLEDGSKIYVGESGHCVNARAFTLVSEEEWRKAVETQDEELIASIGLRRAFSKGGSFATLFGASGKKVATTLRIPVDTGAQKKEAFLKKIGLDRPIAILEEMVSKNARAGGGYIELPFGYYVWSNMPHKFFNYLDQGTEAACQKWAVNYFNRESKRLGLDCFKILDIHDEFLVESAPDVAKDVGLLMCKAYEEASNACWEWHKKHSKWFVGDDLPTFAFNLNGGYDIGENYYDCH